MMEYPKRLATMCAGLLIACASGPRYSAKNPAPFPPIPPGACDSPHAGDLHSDSQHETVIPVATVTPDYPRRAVRKGIQGWICLEFTISPEGKVEDAVVVKSSPAGYFEKAALEAIRQWRYDPKKIDGKPVERPGVRTRLSFSLE